jgi:hypothetical protein
VHNKISKKKLFKPAQDWQIGVIMSIPKDPYILLSYINTKLRDEYQSLDALCENLELEQRHIKTVLSSIDYTYTKELNQFTAV